MTSSTESSEVVFGGDLGSFHERISGGQAKGDPLTIMGGVGDSGDSKDTNGKCAEGDEGSVEGREEHDDERGERIQQRD